MKIPGHERQTCLQTQFGCEAEREVQLVEFLRTIDGSRTRGALPVDWPLWVSGTVAHLGVEPKWAIGGRAG